MEKTIKKVVSVILIGIIMGGWGCAKKEKATTSTDGSEKAILATVNGVDLTVRDYRQQSFYFNALSRLQSDIPEQRLEALVESEVLWQEAKKQKLDELPHIRRQLQQVLVNELIRQTVLPQAQQMKVSDQEVAAFYQANLDRYHTPESVRVAHILIALPDRKAAKTAAEKLLKDPLVNKPGGFSQFVMQQSADKASSIYGGDLGFLVVPNKKQKTTLEPWQAKLVEAAASLKTIGGVYAKVIETEKGFHIVKLTGRQTAADYSLAQVKDKIVRQLSTDLQANAYQQYVKGLKSNASITLNEYALEKISPGGGISAADFLQKQKDEARQEAMKSKLPKREELKENPVVWTPPAVAQPAAVQAGDMIIQAQPVRSRPVMSPAQIEAIKKDPRSAPIPQGQFIMTSKKEVTEKDGKEKK